MMREVTEGAELLGSREDHLPQWGKVGALQVTREKELGWPAGD
jgi:hypothetical protein